MLGGSSLYGVQAACQEGQEREPWRRDLGLWLCLSLSLWLHGGQVGSLEVSTFSLFLVLHPLYSGLLLHTEGPPVSLCGFQSIAFWEGPRL